jgi:hypothetical protein
VKVGDSVEAATQRVGQRPRRGSVTAVSGALITVRWDSGDQTTLIPAAGSLRVIDAAPASDTKKSSPKKATAQETPAAKNPSEKTTAKKPVTKKAAKGHANKKAAKRR